VAYLTVTGRKENTLEALAGKLALGVNTVWTFKTKVNTRIIELSKRGKKPTVSRWEEVILESSQNSKSQLLPENATKKQ
jgi:hypothetical protein